jgi:rhodanese-related sulfurtransferase
MDSYRRVTSDQLRERLRRGESGLLIDLRDYGDFELEHIAGSINEPLPNLKPEDLLRSHGHGPIYLICSNGERAYKAAALLQEHGYFDVIIIAGGILSWRVLGFPLVGKLH